MKVVHIESGLGNQMLSYCELLALQYANPNDKCYVETLVFDYPECNEITCQWNGYELDKIFGISTPNISSLFDVEEWNHIKKEIGQTEFWSHHWNYPKYFNEVFSKHGLVLKNLKGDYEDPSNPRYRNLHVPIKDKIRTYFFDHTRLGSFIKRWHYERTWETRKLSQANPEKLYIKSDDDIFTGLWLTFKFNGNNIEFINDEINKTFRFPAFKNPQNQELASYLESCNSVFIHARRGDMLSANGWCYKYGYFRRAVRYIKKHVDNPVFVFFTNTGSIDWCKGNGHIFDLDYNKDKVLFVDWNKGDESYCDMQLMSHCKHGIITNSTFGWWGAYFIQNPDKITISPMAEINTTHHC